MFNFLKKKDEYDEEYYKKKREENKRIEDEFQKKVAKGEKEENNTLIIKRIKNTLALGVNITLRDGHGELNTHSWVGFELDNFLYKVYYGAYTHPRINVVKSGELLYDFNITNKTGSYLNGLWREKRKTLMEMDKLLLFKNLKDD